MKLSVVTTLYKSAQHIEEFCARTALAAEQLVGDDYEIVLVNDGSPDNSFSIALQLAKINPHILLIDLSRNFGHHKAMMTGLAHAKGELIFLIDSDLEEDPELLNPFSKKMEESLCDVVYGIQEKRKGGFFERISGQLFYRVFRALTGIKIPSNIVVARLMTRRYVNALLLHQEREIFMAGLWSITGFNQEPQIINKKSTSQTTYTLRRKISMFINAITSFSNTPLISIFYVGILILLFSASYAVFLIVNRFVFHTILSGWTSIMASVWLLGGLIISFIGIIGIYLSKIFSEIKQRPYTIVRQKYQKNLIDPRNKELEVRSTESTIDE
ncbi:glycosyltransferase family 2 protein [Legionella sp. 227]|uniref:glycosyltransferase family 2 protein n=1 Tax=Legionella sp. 227 TaxID=3367288 RepID=UPI00370D2A5A